MPRPDDDLADVIPFPHRASRRVRAHDGYLRATRALAEARHRRAQHPNPAPESNTQPRTPVRAGNHPRHPNQNGPR